MSLDSVSRETEELRPITNSIAFLTSGNSGPGSLSFSPDGQFLLVTEKLNNRIDAFHVQLDGTLGPIVVNAGVGPGTFAVVFAPNGAALVSETGPAGGSNASAISSYAAVANGTLSPISASVPTQGAATCWQAVTPDRAFRVYLQLCHIYHLWICDRYRWSVNSLAGNDGGNTANRKHKSRHGDQLRWQIPLHSGLRDWLSQHFRYQRGRVAYQPGRCGRSLRCCWFQWHSGKLVVVGEVRQIAARSPFPIVQCLVRWSQP